MSFEKEVSKKIENNEELEEKINISILKYFWRASPLSRGGDSLLPKFLRKVEVLENFSDNELRILSKYLHMRHFSPKEPIFRQDDMGVGFYFIYTGQVEIWAKNYKVDNNDTPIDTDEEATTRNINLIATLDKGDHFGELALLQKTAVRTASAIAKDGCCLLGILKPDMNELINNNPVVGAKLLQSISIILANRLSSVTTEMKVLKYKYYTLGGYEHRSEYQK